LPGLFGISCDRKNLSNTNGGALPNWRRDGQELFYSADDDQMMSASRAVMPRASHDPIDSFSTLYVVEQLK